MCGLDKREYCIAGVTFPCGSRRPSSFGLWMWGGEMGSPCRRWMCLERGGLIRRCLEPPPTVRPTKGPLGQSPMPTRQGRWISSHGRKDGTVGVGGGEGCKATRPTWEFF